MGEVKWRFFRAGGVDQVRLATGAELVNLRQLDQKLWVALACPVKGLEFDERTLKLIDSDNDGRVRAPELIAAVEWAGAHLSDVEALAKPGGPLSLAAIATHEAGQLLRDTAVALLKALGKPGADSISVADVDAALAAFNKEHQNGDGVVPASAAGEAAALVTELLGVTAAPKSDRSGEPGLDAAAIDAFFEAASAHLQWLEAGRGAEVQPLGEATSAALDALQAVGPKVDDFFARCRIAAFDGRALGAMNREEGAYGALQATQLDAAVSELAGFPLAHVAPEAELPLRRGLNPAWADAVEALRAKVVVPLLGERDSLSHADWRELQGRLAAHAAWRAAQAGAAVAPLGAERLAALVDSDAKERLHALIAADSAAAPRAAAIESVERLVRYQRDLLQLANNFVSFREFYSRKAPAIFQVGTLYLDQRACELCIEVNDAGRHAAMSPLAKSYLVFCDLKNAKGEKRAIVAAVTDGDVDNLMVGRNGIFYDRKGGDWDATITKIVDNPISVRQAFWSPYKKLVRLIEDQINARAAAAEAEADAKVGAAATATQAAAGGEVKAPPKKLDVGVVAALGVAVGGITAAIGALLQAFFGLGIWMPLGVLGLMLLISGPSMAVAWLKLRQRNLGPILDANGWAVNTLAKVNVPLGRALTRVAELPSGAQRDLVDPFAEKRRPWWVIALLFLVVGGGIAWFIGSLDAWLPGPAKSVEVLGEFAPAHVKVQEEPPAEPAAEPAAAPAP